MRIASEILSRTIGLMRSKPHEGPSEESCLYLAAIECPVIFLVSMYHWDQFAIVLWSSMKTNR